MNKRKIILEDRRYLIFYSFSDAGVRPSSEPKSAPEEAAKRRVRRKS